MERGQLYIDGMTCINCQNRIKNCLSKRTGIKDVFVSYETGRATFLYDINEITLDEIIRMVEALGYKVYSKEHSRKEAVLRAIKELLVILVVFFVLQHWGILNRLAPDSLADTGMGYGMLFIIGLITSVHCIAMCGGINLSQTLQKEVSEELGRKMFKNALAYNTGRVVSYTVIGGVLGATGSLIGISNSLQASSAFQGGLKIFAGMIMIIMGVNMLGIFPGLRRLKFRLPVSNSKLAGKKSTPFIVGLCNGFMPCGPLQSMQVVALASGNVMTGAFSMFCFALGTVPLMLGFGSVVSALGKHFTRQVLKLGAILVVVMGLSMLSQGSTMSGLNNQIAGAFSTITAAMNRNNATDRAVEKNGIQYVSSTLESGHYPDITVKAGEPVQWTIQASENNINGCNYKIFLQDFNQEHTFEAGKNVIKFIPEKEGTYTYSCWMGMITGKIYVES